MGKKCVYNAEGQKVIIDDNEELEGYDVDPEKAKKPVKRTRKKKVEE